MQLLLYNDFLKWTSCSVNDQSNGVFLQLFLVVLLSCIIKIRLDNIFLILFILKVTILIVLSLYTDSSLTEEINADFCFHISNDEFYIRMYTYEYLLSPSLSDLDTVIHRRLFLYLSSDDIDTICTETTLNDHGSWVENVKYNGETVYHEGDSKEIFINK